MMDDSDAALRAEVELRVTKLLTRSGMSIPDPLTKKMLMLAWLDGRDSGLAAALKIHEETNG